MKVIDDKSKKKLNWWNRNYFFVATLAIIIINVLVHVLWARWCEDVFVIDGEYHAFNFIPTLLAFFSSFSHSTLPHLLLNMLPFLVVGIYIERKRGSFSTFLLVLFGAYISGLAIVTNMVPTSSAYIGGFSGVNYFLFGYVIIDYIFSFQKAEKNKLNIVFGVIVLIFIYCASCYQSSSEFPFTWYPHDLIYNNSHNSGFVVGLIVTFVISLVRLLARRENRLVVKNGKNKRQQTETISVEIPLDNEITREIVAEKTSEVLADEVEVKQVKEEQQENISFPVVKEKVEPVTKNEIKDALPHDEEGMTNRDILLKRMRDDASKGN